MRKARALLAVPERALRGQVRQLLEAVIPCEWHEAATGPDAYQLAQAHLPDVVIASAELPGYDGLQVTHRLRGLGPFQETPIVVLGPRDQPRKYQAFYVGATEYVELPFDPIEFQCRLRVQLRGLLRARDANEAIACGPALVLEVPTRTVRCGERSAVLTPSEFALLRHLAAKPNTPHSAERLLSEALGHAAGLGNPQLIHTHVRNMRKKLEADPQAPSLLLRHPAGYMLALPDA